MSKSTAKKIETPIQSPRATGPVKVQKSTEEKTEAIDARVERILLRIVGERLETVRGVHVGDSVVCTYAKDDYPRGLYDGKCVGLDLGKGLVRVLETDSGESFNYPVESVFPVKARKDAESFLTKLVADNDARKAKSHKGDDEEETSPPPPRKDARIAKPGTPGRKNPVSVQSVKLEGTKEPGPVKGGNPPPKVTGKKVPKVTGKK